MTRFPLLAATAISLIPLAAAAQTAPMAMPSADQQRMHAMTETDAPLLSFSITEEIKQAPDRASIGAGVTTTAPTAVEALRQNSAAMERVVAALRRARVAERDIQTSGISLSPQYDYTPQQQGQPPRFIGYQVSNQVRVVTADIANLGRLIDTLVDAGGTNLDGPQFFVDNPDANLDGARQTALRLATERAAFYARVAGYRTARLVSLSEGQAMGGPMPMMRMQVRDVAETASTPVQPGQVSSSVTLAVTYKMEK